MTNAESLMRMGKKAAAAMIQAEAVSSSNPSNLNALLDHLLAPEKDLDDGEAMEWCRWIVGGGETYEDFSHRVKKFDVTEKCGLVWTADFVAFRCRTCGISQCMSLCAECFQEGNHEGHDFNMFKSQAGGACDCGDSSVMRPSGFCRKHRSPSESPHHCQHPGSNESSSSSSSNSKGGGPPEDLMAVASGVIPRIFLRLLQHLRVNVLPSAIAARLTASQALSKYEKTIEDAEGLLVLLHDFSSLGAAMRGIMTRVLIDKKIYDALTRSGRDAASAAFMRRSEQLYEDAVADLPNLGIHIPLEHREYIVDDKLRHSTFLEELVFWTVKYEFPELLNCLLLKMLPDATYKEAFTRCFVMHYSRVSITLSQSSNSDRLSNRVVHVSVQLFSNEKLALSMAENYALLHVMVGSLVYNMMSKVLIPCRLHSPRGAHLVIDCKNHITKDHCYWPLVSDLSNVLSHQPIALKFMSDNGLLSMWFSFLQMLQGMNVNERELESHIEFEPSTYYASFSAELEASASPMWALLSHLKDRATGQYTVNVIKHCIVALLEWFKINEFTSPSQCDMYRVSFHIPLHRYFSMFVRQGVIHHGYSLKELLPEPEVLWLLMAHPLRVQTAFYEIMAGIWLRNGLQIKGQAMTYLQCHFCKSMVDADIFLLQISATQLPPASFLGHVLEVFQMDDWLSFGSRTSSKLEPEQVVPMLESCLTFLASLLVLRSNLGLSETELARLEMVTLLCTGDKQHSKLFDSIPEKSANPIQIELFDSVLLEVGQYREPQFEAGGNMQQGIYLPRPQVWENLYDPIYVLLRAVHRKDFQASIDRFTEYAKNKFAGSPERLQTIQNLWPPWRLPSPVHPGFDDPRRLLHSRFSHGLIFNILYKAVHDEETLVSEHIISLAVFLLELAITYPQSEFSGKEVAVSKPWLIVHKPTDLKYETWYPTDWLSANLRHVVSAIFIPSDEPNPEWSPSMQMEVDSDEGRPPESVSQDPSSPPVTYSSPAHAIVPRPGSPEGADPGTLPLLGDSLKPINESIISLLLKLHSKLSVSNASSSARGTGSGSTSGDPSYTPLSERSGHSASPVYRESRIGNGVFFLEKVLDRICELDNLCREDLLSVRASLWPSSKSSASEESGSSDRRDAERRKRARVRQKQMMDQLADQQRRFLASMGGAEGNSPPVPEDHGRFDCVHCHTSSPSSEERPMGLVALLQPSSLLAHRRSSGRPLVLPSMENRTPLGGDPSSSCDMLLGDVYGKRSDELRRMFGSRGALGAHGGWDWGIHIQSCGHMLHLTCRQSYMEHLKSQVRAESNQILDVDLGEYMCPMCRQMGNSFLPLPPPPPPKVVVSPSHGPEALHSALSSPSPSVSPGSALSTAGLRLMEEFLKAREVPPEPNSSSFFSSPHSLFDFVSSLARTNLELDLVQRGSGGLLLLPQHNAKPSSTNTTTTSTNMSEPLAAGGNQFKTCFVPLLHVLSNHVKNNCALDLRPEWRSLTGIREPRTNVEGGKFVPLLLQDCSALLIHFLLLLPVPCEIGLYDTLTRALFHLKLAQSLAVTSCAIGSAGREAFLKKLDEASSLSSPHPMSSHPPLLGDEEGGNSSSSSSNNSSRRRRNNSSEEDNDDLSQRMALIIRSIQGEDDSMQSIYPHLSNDSDGPFEAGLSPDFLESRISTLVLPFLQLSALIRSYLNDSPLPDRRSPDERGALMSYLGLLDNNKAASFSLQSSPLPSPSILLRDWLEDFRNFASGPLQGPSAGFLLRVNTLWGTPMLVNLPKNYDAIFQYYHRKECEVCHRVPKDPSICLLCGELVCFKESCCRFRGNSNITICEAVRHSYDCGAGTAMFLAVNSSYIIVVRGRRACVWGSIYLDSFGEEDKELKRGRPLYLNEERYNLLRTQWISHRFSHYNRTWIWHWNQL